MFLLDFLFPKTCRSCGDSFRHGLSNVLCLSCFNSIKPYEEPVCDRCGVSLPIKAFEDAVRTRCVDCGEEDSYLDQVRAFGAYEGALRLAHHAFKFEGMEGLGGIIGEKMKEATSSSFWEGVDAVVPVPLSPERQRERGYNPSFLLAKGISNLAKVPLRSLIIKTKSTEPQMVLSREQRIRNPKGVYQYSSSGRFAAKVILVDDVLTTGATLEECAKVLKRSKVSWVGALVFGRTPLHFQSLTPL